MASAKAYNLIAHSRSVFKSFQFIVKNRFPYGENEWDVYFKNTTVHSFALFCIA